MRLSRIILPLALSGVAALPVDAHAQQQRIGSFAVERRNDLITDEDRSYAAVTAESNGQEALTLVWACFDDYLAIGFSPQPGYTSGYGTESEMRVHWRFDREEPEAVTLSRVSLMERVFMIPEDYRFDFTARVRGSSRFVVRVLNFSTRPADYVFDLTGSERALNSLGCVRGLRSPKEPPGLLGRSADEVVAEPSLPLETRADTLRMFEHYTPENMRERRGEVAVRAQVTADGRVSFEEMQVTRTAHEQLNVPAMFIVSQLTFPPGGARWVTVYVYFSPTGGHVQIEDPL